MGSCLTSSGAWMAGFLMLKLIFRNILTLYTISGEVPVLSISDKQLLVSKN